LKVAQQVGRGMSGQVRVAVARFDATFLQHGAYVTLTCQASHGGAHIMTRRQELQDAMAAYEARSSGDQNCAHLCFMKRICQFPNERTAS
jgi:hypothetical protein